MLLRCLVDMNFVEAQRTVGRLTSATIRAMGSMLMLPLGPLGQSRRECPIGSWTDEMLARRLAASWNALLGLPDAMVAGVADPQGSLMSVMGDLLRAHPHRGGTEAGMLLSHIRAGTLPHPLHPMTAIKEQGWSGHPFDNTLVLDGQAILHQDFHDVCAQRLTACWNGLGGLDENGVNAMASLLDLLCTLALSRHAGRGQGVRIGDLDWDACVLGHLIITTRLDGGGYVLPSGMEAAASRLTRCCGDAAARMTPLVPVAHRNAAGQIQGIKTG